MRPGVPSGTFLKCHLQARWYFSAAHKRSSGYPRTSWAAPRDRSAFSAPGLPPLAVLGLQLTHGTVPPAFLFRRSAFLQWLCAPEQILTLLDVLPDHHATLVTMTFTVFHSPYISYIMYLLYIK